MAIVKKNTPVAEVAEVKQPKAKKEKVVAAVEVVEPEPEVEVESIEASKVGRKQLAVMIQERVRATGKAVPLPIAEIMVVAYEEAVAEALSFGADVNLPGFGKFICTEKAEAEKRNPSNGEMVTVPAHKAVRFKVGANLKKVVNAGVEDEDDDE